MTTRKTVLKILFIIVAVAINAFIIINSLLPGEESSSVATPVVKLVGDIANLVKEGSVPSEPYSPTFISLVRKIVGHFSLFFIDAIFSFCAINSLFEKKSVKILVFSLIFGFSMSIGSELLQLIPVGRSCLISDMGIDFSGYLFGSLIVFAIFSLIYKRYKNNY